MQSDVDMSTNNLFLVHGVEQLLLWLLKQGSDGGSGEGVEHQWNTIIINGPQGGSDKPLEQHL